MESRDVAKRALDLVEQELIHAAGDLGRHDTQLAAMVRDHLAPAVGRAARRLMIEGAMEKEEANAG